MLTYDYTVTLSILWGEQHVGMSQMKDSPATAVADVRKLNPLSSGPFRERTAVRWTSMYQNKLIGGVVHPDEIHTIHNRLVFFSCLKLSFFSLWPFFYIYFVLYISPFPQIVAFLFVLFGSHLNTKHFLDWNVLKHLPLAYISATVVKSHTIPQGPHVHKDLTLRRQDHRSPSRKIHH